MRPLGALLWVGWHPYTFQPLKRGVDPRVACCGERVTQGLDGGKMYHAIISKSHADTGRRAAQRPDLRASRIKAGVTSDARQVTSARSADRFKGFRGFPAGLLTGVYFRADGVCFPTNTAVPTGWGGVYQRFGGVKGTLSTENKDRLASLIYKHTVELDMMMGILADSYELTEEDMRRRRAESVRNVKNTNGRLPFEQKVRAANEAEDEWPD